MRQIHYCLTTFLLFSCLLLWGVVYADEVESSNFKIRGDNLSSGAGTGNSSSYGLIGDINPFSDLSDSTSFRQEVGYSPRIQAFVPLAPTLDNPSEYYDRLHLTINPSGNPSDTLFAVAVSDDDWLTYQYLQNSGILGDTLGIEDYQTYTTLGGASGMNILGLEPSRTYKATVKALNGNFTETGYGPESGEASTIEPYINMQVTAGVVNMGVLNVASVSQTTNEIVTINTNAFSGYQVYVSDEGNGSNPGLYDGVGYLITSADMTLNPGTEGYGAQASSGTATIDAKYDVSGNQVGGLDVSSNALFSNTDQVSGESSNILFKAAISGLSTAGNYSDLVYYTIVPNL